jgi:trimethylamine--corrinoid protein Co-methyltransferase
MTIMNTTLDILKPEEVEALQDAAFQILEQTGARVSHDGALNMLRGAGATVDGEIVKLPRSLVESCIATAPKGFLIYNREGEPALDLHTRQSYYGTSTASPNTRDYETGEVRPTTLKDIENGARVADALANIDFVMPMGSAQDVPAGAADLHEFIAVVANTTKPIVPINYTARGLELVCDMAAAVRGGQEALAAKPFILTYPEPVSPLLFPQEIVEKMLIAAERNVPQIPGTTVQPGATAPVTMAGATAQLIAEGLVSLVIIQLKSPGAPCCLAGNFNVFDMKTALLSIASPEMSLGLAAQVQVARAFGLPTWGLAGATDAKVIDSQAGAESVYALLAQSLAGLNLIHDVGYMDMAMVCSPEMLVLGDELAGMVKRFMQGFEVTPDTLALDLIEKVGPGGSFIQEKHTFEHFRKELWFPRILTREHSTRWVENGRKDATTRCREKVQQILTNHVVPELPPEVVAELHRLRDEGEREIIGT